MHESIATGSGPGVHGHRLTSASCTPFPQNQKGRGSRQRDPAQAPWQCGGGLWTGTFQHRAGEEGALVPLVLNQPSSSYLKALVPRVTKKTHRTMSGAQEVLNKDSQIAVLVISSKHAWEHHLLYSQGLGSDAQADLGHAALGLLRPCTAPGHPARTPGGNKDKHSCQQGLAPSRDLEEGKFHEESKPRLGHMSHLEGMSPC